jgi:hypothetical protein
MAQAHGSGCWERLHPPSQRGRLVTIRGPDRGRRADLRVRAVEERSRQVLRVIQWHAQQVHEGAPLAISNSVGGEGKQQPDTKRACHGMPTPSMPVEATCVLGEGSRQPGSGEVRGRHGPYAARNRASGVHRVLVNSTAKSCATRHSRLPVLLSHSDSL